jgi:RNA 3'-terminal phosphate cyclase
VGTRTEHTRLGAAAVAERGVPAEALGEAVGTALAAELASGASLDVHAADQLLVYLALAGGRSQFRAREFSSHARTTACLLESLLGTRVSTQGGAGAVQVEVCPASA